MVIAKTHNLLFNSNQLTNLMHAKPKPNGFKTTLAAVFLLFSSLLNTQEPQADSPFIDKIVQESFFGDYDEMLERRLIRVLVTTNKTNFFINQASQSGITYEFFKEFEKQINEFIKSKHLKVHVVFIPVARDELIPALNKGRGDVAAASLTITEARSVLADFTDPLASNINEVIVTSMDMPTIQTLDELSGKKIVVHRSSSYYEHLLQLNNRLVEAGKGPIDIELAAEYLEDEDLLEMVNANLIPMIVVDDYLAQFWSQVLDNIKLHTDANIHRDGKIAWMIRKNSPMFKQVLDDFIKEHKIGTLFGNIMKKRYFQNTGNAMRAFSTQDTQRFKQAADLFQKYSAEFEFDWLMIAALSYQESRIDQSVVSPAGAVGVMQVLPSSAAGDPINITNIDDIENNIHAGVKYLRWIFDQYFRDDPHVDELNKMLLTFASYNAGPAKVARLRKEANEMGLNPNIWFNNVEVSAAKIIGRETVQYVSNIYKYYFAYLLISENRKIKDEHKKS